MVGANFKKASLTTEGDDSIEFEDASLDGASFEEASLTTMGNGTGSYYYYTANINFFNASLPKTSFKKASLATTTITARRLTLVTRTSPTPTS